MNVRHREAIKAQPVDLRALPPKRTEMQLRYAIGLVSDHVLRYCRRDTKATY